MQIIENENSIIELMLFYTIVCIKLCYKLIDGFVAFLPNLVYSLNRIKLCIAIFDGFAVLLLYNTYYQLIGLRLCGFA